MESRRLALLSIPLCLVLAEWFLRSVPDARDWLLIAILTVGHPSVDALRWLCGDALIAIVCRFSLVLLGAHALLTARTQASSNSAQSRSFPGGPGPGPGPDCARGDSRLALVPRPGCDRGDGGLAPVAELGPTADHRGATRSCSHGGGHGTGSSGIGCGGGEEAGSCGARATGPCLVGMGSGVGGALNWEGSTVRDVLYEYVELSPLAMRFVNTVEFQWLRDLRQLGSASYVFPSANHTRFEHSIGVYHLAGRVVRAVLKYQPHLLPQRWKRSGGSRLFVELVRLAGLLHDIGHYACSHCFDQEVAPALNLPDHEERGVAIVRDMVRRYAIPLQSDEVDLVCGLILGDQGLQPAWIRGIIHNRENEVDCDKWDYLMRDSYYLRLGAPIQVSRLLLNIRVLPTAPRNPSIPPTVSPHATVKPLGDQKAQSVQAESDQEAEESLRICYNKKVFLQVCDVFQTRYRLFREVYRHRVIVGVDEMMGELMRGLIPVFRLWLNHSPNPPPDPAPDPDPKHRPASALAHSTIDAVPVSHDAVGFEAVSSSAANSGGRTTSARQAAPSPPGGPSEMWDLWSWLRVRPTDAALASLPQWLPFVPDSVIKVEVKRGLLLLWERIRSRRLYRVVETDDPSEADIHIRLGLSALKDDPVERVWFYDKRGRVSHIRIHQVTKLLGSSPRVASETLHYKLSKDS
jgi:HD superfamily phosphohydrolase